MMATKRKAYTGLAAILAGASLPTLAWAQAAAPAPAPPSSTQTAETPVGPTSGVVDEVIVTAQKRSENVQNVPISIAAFNARSLEQAGIGDVRDLRRVTPSLFLATAPQVTNTRLSIRGIGSSANTAIEPSVASFIDGVYVPRVGSLLGGLNDIDSVEVLRGPQGTLFGRNASVGALSFHTVAPRPDYEAQGTVTFGNYGRQKATAVINAPVNDKLALRLSILGDRYDGYGKNELTGQQFSKTDTFSIRGSARWEITDNITWTLRLDHQHLVGDGVAVISVDSNSVTPTATANLQARLDPDGAGPQVGQLPKLNDTFSRSVRQDTLGNLEDHQFGLSSDIDWNIGAGYTLKLISGYRDWTNKQFEDSTADLPLPLSSRFGRFDSQSTSEELQLLSPTTLFNSRFNYVAGVYYFHEDYFIGENLGLNPGYCNVFVRNTAAAQLNNCLAGAQANATNLAFNQETTSYAVYAQGTYNLTSTWDLTFGLRYTDDDKTGSFIQQTNNLALLTTRALEQTALKTAADKVTYRVNTTWKPMRNVMLFATYATGFKSGGFDSGGGAPAGGAKRVFNPELTENYELGAKTQFFERKLTLNATLYRTDISDYQFRTYDGVSFRVQNNGEIRQQGVEFDTILRPITPLTLTLSGAYLDSTFLEFKGAPGLPGFGGTQDLTGQRVPYSPEWQIAASGQYDGKLPWYGLNWALHGDLAYTDDINLNAGGDNNPQTLQPAFVVLGARFSVSSASGKYEASIYGQNLGNEGYCNSKFAQPNDAAFGLRSTVTGGTLIRCVVSEPRTYGVQFKARF